MSVENGFNTAFYEHAGSIDIELGKTERVVFDPSHTPHMLDYEETNTALGINGEVLGGIDACRKQFLIVDLTKSPETADGLKIIMNEPLTATPARYLLLDETFNFDTNRGIKGVVPGEPAVRIGRNHMYDRFAYPPTTSGDHFELEINKQGLLEIQNLHPKNWTRIIAGRPNVTESIAVYEEEAKPSVEVGVIRQDLKGDDRYLIDEFGLTFGVFDGAGGVGRGDLAAEQALQTCTRLSAQRNLLAHTASAEVSRSNLVQILEEANNEVAANVAGSITTGTLARIVIEGNDTAEKVPYVVWAHAGDSRLYIMRQGIATQITKDEGVGNRLRNYLGEGGEVSQSGINRLEPGDILMLVSDGITGDFGSDLLEESEISAACRNKDAQGVADKLLEISRKRDDKTAVVIKYVG